MEIQICGKQKKGKQVIVECFLLLSHSFSMFGAMAEGMQ